MNVFGLMDLGAARCFGFLGVVLCLGAGAGRAGTTPAPPQAPNAAETGIASYYADQYQGKSTASGERFDTHQLTAAHRRLKFGTRVKVTNLENQRFVVVRINDRGPFLPGRVIDLSRAAAQELQMINSGVVLVRLEVLPN